MALVAVPVEQQGLLGRLDVLARSLRVRDTQFRDTETVIVAGLEREIPGLLTLLQ